jgi:three-Cys-motif partner protein
MDDFEWLKDKVERLAGVKQEIGALCNSGNHKTYDKGLWAFWKLLIHAYYVDIFTNVAKENRENVGYIDLLAGPGFNKLKDLDLIIAGSPLIAKLSPRITKKGQSKNFDWMILVDIDESNCSSLNQILDAIILCDNCNSDRVMSEIQKEMQPESSIYLAFIDPEGTQVLWSTMENLFALPGDLIINHPWSGVARIAGNYYSRTDQSRESFGETLDNFFGDSAWRDITPNSIAEDLYDFYLSRITKYRSEIVEFSVTMAGGGQYRIVVATQRTRRGSPWLKPLRELRDRLSRISDTQLERLVQVYKGNQTQLTDF